MDRELKRRIIIENSTDESNVVNVPLNNYSVSAVDKSASCSDDWTIYLMHKDEIVHDIKFSGSGCAISRASINILAKILIGKSISFAEKIINDYEVLITTGNGDENVLGELMALDNVHTLVNRIECGLLGAKTIKKLIKE